MRRLLVTLALATLFAGGCSRPDAPRDKATTTPSAPGETLTVMRDDADIFRRAFWRHPAPADRIVHAERREWAGAEGVRRWQWFMAIRPSPELLRDLRTSDKFNLVRIETPRPWADPAAMPAWFPGEASSAFEILQAPAGTFTLLYRAADNTLFATDQGHGFAPPVSPLAKSGS